MAERRMFTKTVTDDDNFMALSSSAQALYLHLSMSADDDGFCNKVAISMFKAHASISDLESLLEKRYIYQFKNGVIVIKHWRMANALRKDRYIPTVFQEELKLLNIKENGSYTLNTDSSNNGCRLVATCLPQDRLGKDSIGKDNILSSCSDEERDENGYTKEERFEFIRNLYPKERRGSRAKSWKAYCDYTTHGKTYCGKKLKFTERQIHAGVKRYIAQQEALKNEPRFYKNFETLMNQIDDYIRADDGKETD